MIARPRDAAPVLPAAPAPEPERGPGGPDSVTRTLAGALALLLGLGLVGVYSSSAVYAGRLYGDPARFLKAQLAWVALGSLGLAVAERCPQRLLAKRCGWLLLAAMAAGALVLVPGVGRLVGGARRWLVLGPLTWQPSELIKLAVVIFLAALLGRRARVGRGSLLPAVLWCQMPVALVLLEPDLGTALVIELLMLTMVFAAGLPWRTLGLCALGALPVLYRLTVGTPFRLRRLLSYIDPWAYRSTTGYQVTEALISIGAGGLTGVGLGEGRQKLFFLPEAHTDFIFAILAEELGLLGVAALIGAFAALSWAGMALARRAPDPFDRYLALGLTGLIALPAAFNVAVATGLLPTKGLPLPLVSYGGSNLVVTMVAVGMLRRIGRDCRHVVPARRLA